MNSSAINATCFFAEGTISRGCLFLLRDSTVLLNISLKSGDVVAMGTAPSTPGLLIENIVAVEVLENGDPSEIQITPAATVVTLPIPTTQPPGMCVWCAHVFLYEWLCKCIMFDTYEGEISLILSLPCSTDFYLESLLWQQ